jgi:DNA-binding transcriptional ArsR family regulator
MRTGPLSVGELADGLPISRPAVSQHLRILKDAGLVHEHREGTRHYFSLNPAGFADLRQYIDTMWGDALNAFARYAVARNKPIKRKNSP